MSFYVICCIWPALLGLFISPNRYKKLFVFLAFAPYIGISALRGFRVGTDTAQYTGIYSSIIKAGWNQFGVFRYEPLFTAFCKLIGYISNDPHYLVFFSSLFMGGCTIYAVLKLSPMPMLSCSLYGLSLLFFTNLSMMRQAMACSLILAGLPFLLRKQRRKFLFFVVAAFLFHYSSIVFSLACLVAGKWYRDKSHISKKKSYNLFFLLAFAILTPTFIWLFPKIFNAMGLSLYASYLQIGSYMKFVANSIMLAPLLLLLFFMSLKKQDYDARFWGFIVFSELILNLCSVINSSVFRISWYFHSALFLLVPIMIGQWSMKNRKSFCLFVYFFFLAYSLVIGPILLHEWGLLPYEFAWNESLKLETSWRDQLL